MNGPDRLGLRGPCHRCRSQWLTQFQLRGAQPRPGRVVSLTHYPTVTTSIVLSTLLWLKGCFVPLLVRYIILSYLNCRDAALHMFITTSALSSCSHVFGTQYLRVYTCLEAMPDRRWRTRGSTTFYRIITPRVEERGQIPYVRVEASLRRPVCTSLGCDFAKLPEVRLTRSQKQDNTDVNIHEGRVFNTRRQWTMPRGKQVLLIGAASCVITAPQLEAG